MSENLRPSIRGAKVTLGELMTYAEAKEIALLRLELSACGEANDRIGAVCALQRLVTIAANDRELVAETRRWQTKLAA